VVRNLSFFKKGIRKYANIKAHSLIAPEFFGGINLSDNYSFWQHHYRTIMVTDTSFFGTRITTRRQIRSIPWSDSPGRVTAFKKNPI
jgi:hypothetical protein